VIVALWVDVTVNKTVDELVLVDVAAALSVLMEAEVELDVINEDAFAEAELGESEEVPEPY